MFRRLFFAVTVLVGATAQPVFADTKIFVASSLVDVVEALADASGIDGLSVVAGSSSSLARQIKAGAPAQMYISANRDWADYVAGGREVVSLFSNRLVLVSHNKLVLKDIASLPGLLGASRLAVADPNHVPAGIYAREALESAGQWSRLKEQLAPADNVRAAARLVQLGAAPFGIVYASDAKLLELNVAFEFATKTHMPIVYWAVNLDEDGSKTVAFMQFLGSDNARAIVTSYGFLPFEAQ